LAFSCFPYSFVLNTYNFCILMDSTSCHGLHSRIWLGDWRPCWRLVTEW
jgi:hypothetical protein